eukprot:TRINITY_DN17330_c0_g1_i2.p1 TRINITY_DN17330_c0_g1~~TRINITY_DN17330_c0_g1_i2.p1  ORF type:complete len:273 (-),score=52.41 TRINITY_DN17330_c0_g1_i2:63-881(-)
MPMAPPSPNGLGAVDVALEELDREPSILRSPSQTWFRQGRPPPPNVARMITRFRAADAPDHSSAGAKSSRARRSNDWLMNLVGSVNVMWRSTKNMETFWVLSVTLTAIFLVDRFLEIPIALSWTFVSIVIVFPLTATISMSFTRREEALTHFGELRALVHAVALAHRDWACDWEALGGAHQPAVVLTLTGLVNDLQGYLSTPRMYARDTLLKTENRQLALKRVNDVRALHYARICSAIGKLSRLCETKKGAGMPANEASRLNQYAYLSLIHI